MESRPKEENTHHVPLRKRVTLTQIGVACVIAAILAGVTHYGLSVEHESAFQDERAFRVLEELATQIRYLESSRVVTLSSLPPVIAKIAPLCTDPNRTIRKHRSLPANITEPFYRSFVARLEFATTTFCALEPEAPGTAADRQTRSKIQALAESMCAGSYPGQVSLSIGLRENQLISVACRDDSKLVLQEALDRAVNRFVSQDFFDEAILALEDGTVVEEFPRHTTVSSAAAVLLHRAVADRLNIISAKITLHPTPDADVQPPAERATSAPPTPATALVDHLEPFAWTTKIAQQPYRVSVLPFNVSYSLRPTMSPAKDPGATEHLYIIGLHRMDWTGDVMQALWPVGLWAAVLLLALNVAAWPLLSLALGPPEESISVGRAVGCLVGLVVVPALLITAAASLWSDLSLQSWMRTQARDYATNINIGLRQMLIDDARILTSFRPVYLPFVAEAKRSSSSPRCADPMPLPLQALGSCAGGIASQEASPLFSFDLNRVPVAACLAAAPDLDIDDACDNKRVLTSTPLPADSRWSPFRSILAVNEYGERFGPALSPFEHVYVSPFAKIDDREYFQALKAGQGWMLEMGTAGHLPMVAQRLYNRSDASKALQIAVPLCDPQERSADSRFCGIITGDTRAYSLTSPVSPPLMKFAVIDITTGTVIFSSTDTRSLAENFFRETEQDAGLHAAISSRRSGDFLGRYLGEPHRFFYMPIPNVPWAVLTFYPTKDLADLSFHAGSAALTSYVGLVLALIVVALAVRWVILLFKPRWLAPVPLIRRAWPTLPLHPRYRHLSRFRPSSWALAALFVATLCSLGPLATCGIAFVMLVLTAGIGLFLGPPADQPSHRTPAQQYAECVVTFLTAVSILPAYMMFLHFHQIQFNALIQDGLVANGAQIQSRYDSVNHELRRFIPPDGREWDGRTSVFPEPWSLVLRPNVGLSISRDARPSSLLIEQATEPLETPEPQKVWLYELLVWKWTTSSLDQARRIAITAATSPHDATPDTCGRARGSGDDLCILRMADGSQLAFRSSSRLDGTLFGQELEWKWTRLAAIAAAIILAAMATSFCSRLFAVRLLGLTDRRAELSRITPDTTEGRTAASLREKWKKLSHAERLILYQIAHGHLVNPRNVTPLEKLLRAGLVRLDPWPVLGSPDLAESVLHAESEAEFSKWQHEAGISTWQTVRGPLFVVTMIAIAWLSWAAGGAMKAISAILVATVAFLAQIAQLFNFARGGPPPKGPSAE